MDDWLAELGKERCQEELSFPPEVNVADEARRIAKIFLGQKTYEEKGYGAPIIEECLDEKEVKDKVTTRVLHSTEHSPTFKHFSYL